MEEHTRNNAIHLKLPNVSTETSPPDNDEKFCSESAYLPFEMAEEQEESLDKRKPFLEQHLHQIGQQQITKDLQHLYSFLQQLTPISSETNVLSNNGVSHSRSRPLLRRQKGNQCRVGSNPLNHDDSFYSTDTGQLDTDFDFEEENEQPGQKHREILKMPSINLYQSILSPSLFQRRRRKL